MRTQILFVALWAFERRQRFPGAVVVVAMGDDVVGFTAVFSAKIYQITNPLSACCRGATDTQRGIRAFDGAVGALPQCKKCLLITAPERRTQVRLVPHFEPPVLNHLGTAMLHLMAHGFEHERFPLVPILGRAGATARAEAAQVARRQVAGHE